MATNAAPPNGRWRRLRQKQRRQQQRRIHISARVCVCVSVREFVVYVCMLASASASASHLFHAASGWPKPRPRPRPVANVAPWAPTREMRAGTWNGNGNCDGIGRPKSKRRMFKLKQNQSRAERSKVKRSDSSVV